MSDSEDNSRPTAFGALGLLVKNPLLATSNEGDVESNGIPTSSMKESSETAGERTSDFDHEDIQRRMTNLIQELKSDSITPDDPTVRRRKSATSAHLIDGDGTASAPIIEESSSNKPPQEPRRSISESMLTDTDDLPLPVPIQQVESNTDEDTDGSTRSKQGQAVETAQSKNGSRKSSASQKRPSSALSGDKRAQIPENSNQGAKNASRQSSRNQSPINRPRSSQRSSRNQSPIGPPRSPRVEDSNRTPAIVEPKRPGSSSSNNPKQKLEPPIAIISPASRQPSANKSGQQPPGSRPSTAKRSQHSDNSSESSTDRSSHRQRADNERSKLIKLGEQLQLPTDNIDNQRINSPPPSASPKELLVLTNPLLENNTSKTSPKNSRPGSQSSRKGSTTGSVNQEKPRESDVVSNKSRTSSRASKQQPKFSDEKVPSPHSGRESQTSKHDQKDLKDSRRSSTDVNVPTPTSTKQKQERTPSSTKTKSPSPKRSAQTSRKNSSNAGDRNVPSPVKVSSAKSPKQNEKRLSNSESDNERKVPSPVKVSSAKSPKQNEKRLSNSESDNERKVPKLSNLHSSSEASTPRNGHQTNAWTKKVPIPPLQTTDDDARMSRPQSPNVEQIAERNQHSSSNKKGTNERKQKPKRRSNSAESFNHIRLVDDKSLDSASGNNTESEHPKQRRVKSKKKDVETNTDARNGNQQQRETTSQKSSKSMSSHSPSIRRRIGAKQYELTTPDTEPDSNVPTARRALKKPKIPTNGKAPGISQMESTTEDFRTFQEKERNAELTTDQERQTQSDTEHVIGKKQKKRRRPKRISRTTQTYECVFRRMERDQHEELLPTNNTEKCVQTRRSCLRPVTRSPKRNYLSTDAFKIEEILPKPFLPLQRSTNASRTSVSARNPSPPGGKLLILRPTLPFHHTDAVNVQRVNLHYSIDLIPNENKSNDATPGYRTKNNALKPSEETNSLPMIRSSPTPNQLTTKTNTKDRSTANKFDNRLYPRKTGGAV